jgi:hypothetical protein
VSIEHDVQEYLRADRQWTRTCRLAHAKMQLSQAKSPRDTDFWQRVIDANTVKD